MTRCALCQEALAPTGGRPAGTCPDCRPAWRAMNERRRQVLADFHRALAAGEQRLEDLGPVPQELVRQLRAARTLTTPARPTRRGETGRRLYQEPTAHQVATWRRRNLAQPAPDGVACNPTEAPAGPGGPGTLPTAPRGQELHLTQWGRE